MPFRFKSILRYLFPTTLLSAFAPKGARDFWSENAKTGLGLAMIAIPKPVFSGFTVFWAIFALKARKLPDLSGRQIRQLLWQRMKDSNPHKRSQSPVWYHYTNPLSARDIIL